VRVARAAKGISQEALADEAGVDRSYMSRIERGVTWAGVEILVQLAAVLDVEPHELLMPPPGGNGDIVFAWEGAVAVATEAEHGMIGSHRFLVGSPPMSGLGGGSLLRLDRVGPPAAVTNALI
jgi:DNA-binding XRE family transcriptional regulator